MVEADWLNIMIRWCWYVGSVTIISELDMRCIYIMTEEKSWTLMLFECWASVIDGRPTLKQHQFNVINRHTSGVLQTD